MELEPMFVKAAVTALLCMIIANFTEGACPQIVFIERTNSSTISCVTEDKIIAEAFWYRGSISDTVPILRLEKGNPGGTEYDEGQYTIDRKGAMIIHNASLEHEGHYFFVAFFKDDSSEKSNVTVVITVQPDPPCPKVTNCFSCEECNLNGSGNGVLTCSMIGVRPHMSINWITEDETGIETILHPLNMSSNPNGYTWDVSIGLSYRTYTCGQVFVLHCIAHDDYKLLNYSTSVHIDTGNCEGGSKSNKQPVVITIIVVLAILIPITVVSAICYKCRHKDQQPMQTTVDPEEQPLTSSKSVYLDTEAQRIADDLKKAYEPYCLVHVLPWEDPIPITSVNIDYELALENAPGMSTNSYSCQEILRNISLNDLHRTMIEADRGNGKTHFIKQIIHQWCQEKVNSFILLYIDAEEVCQSKDIIDMMLGMLPQSHDLTKEAIHQVLNSSEVLILVDGLDDLMSVGDGEKSATTENEKQQKCDTESTDNICTFNARLTITEILEDSPNEKGNSIHVWGTSSGRHYTRHEFKIPYVKIKLPKFSEQQMNSYIEKICSYYINFKAGKQKNRGNSKEVFRMVQKIVTENNVLRDFENNLSLFVLLIHIITAKLTISPEYIHSLNVDNMASLLATAVKTLLESYNRNNTKLSEDLMGKIETKLGEIAFKMTFPDEAIQVSFPKDSDNIVGIAEKVGILQKEKQDTSIDFYFIHTRIEEYFAAKFISKLDNVKYASVRKTVEESDCHEGVWKFILCREDLK